MLHIDSNKLLAISQNEENTKKNKISAVLKEKNWKFYMEYPISSGRMYEDSQGHIHKSGNPKKADYVLFYRNNIPLAVVEAKGGYKDAKSGYQQAVDYAREIGAPYAYSTNGDDLIEEDFINKRNNDKLKLKDLPGPDELWQRYVNDKKLSKEQAYLIAYPYWGGAKTPRYYQMIAINRTIEAIAEGRKRILLVLATGTGKTFTAFQIIWRLREAKAKKKILFLADRNILIDQSMKKDFKPFSSGMTKIDNSDITTSRDIYLSLYQQLSTSEKEYYKQFAPDFFDLVVVDECHRSSANPESNWHDILTYFSSATQIGMTATPKEDGLQEAQNAVEEAQKNFDDAKCGTDDEQRIASFELDRAKEKLKEAESHSSVGYFGNPLYIYSLKQGIEDGYLAPYKVISVKLNIDETGYLPVPGMKDINGNPVEDRVYTQNEFDKKIIVEERRNVVAKRIAEYLKATDRYAKTILFCENIEHCQAMVLKLRNENNDLSEEELSRYVVEITAERGSEQLENFVDPSSKYPVIAVTSRLMSTGVDAETCKNIILDRTVGSMTEFKQIIGRGTRIKEQYEVDGEEQSKLNFTIIDFRCNYLKFKDPAFDGDPVNVSDVQEGESFSNVIKYEKKENSFATLVKSKHVLRISGVDVSITDENVSYLDEDGKLVEESLEASLKNRIVSSFPSFDEFKKTWFKIEDKTSFVSDLLLVQDNWQKRFSNQYGYDVDDFDIIASLAYGIHPVSRKERSERHEVSIFIENLDERKKIIARILLDAYVVSGFNYLKRINDVLHLKQFEELGYKPKGIIRDFFDDNKENYFKLVKKMENALYE